ncbi:putative toxin-antitoxin system, toxin component, YafQ family [Campylobacter avium LMG 24591]|uniref:Putative toxin-antitoxin system, toxin component, YafQ family n=1 Tax=Campylobacter avium LMG 24591 TaxID=522484 RepID=A0A222MWC7_9BACT|nr:type II toxin-antitoxin system YafQ family toxin [Campylobacter avium]ASQ29958.1 putative toxin-antitoxin system, toxin component, YafQ family [Campylobacter avium LMG 24591]OYD79057.1 putative toxin-antitoxin system, toxin component, YafQ family [Campylobacter avium]
MKYKIIYSKEYKKSFKKLKKDDILLLESILEKLANDEKLDIRYKNHQLKGKLKGIWDCHIKPDLVLLYKKDSDKLILSALRIGSHSEIFS